MKRPSIKYSRRLRKNQTDAEYKLWSMLRNRQLDGVKFRRQFSIGNYILDFYSPEHRLCIEADGGQHYEEKGRTQDIIRTNELSKLGIKTLRFSDYEILTNIDGVCEEIYQEIEKKKNNTPHPNPLPRLGRGNT